MMGCDDVVGVRLFKSSPQCFVTLDRHERFASCIGILDGEERAPVDRKRAVEEIEEVAALGPEKNRNDHQTAQADENAIPADAPNFLFKKSLSHDIASNTHLADAPMIS